MKVVAGTASPLEPASIDGPLSAHQKEYLEGFAAGLAAFGRLSPGGAATAAAVGAPSPAPEPETWFGFPLDEITNEERLKRDRNPLDIWDHLVAHAEANQAPAGGDVYRFKFHGLFYVAPAQDAFMVRVRVPGNVLSSVQLRALAAIARDLGGGHGDVTTRGNVQIREIAPISIVEVLTRLSEVGLSSRGAGADNVRNITSSPLAGIDPDELIDARPFARALQHRLANNRDLFGLPRKFNVGFDGGGCVSVVAGTNDIGFVATRCNPGAGLPAGVQFRVALGGVTGHLRFATDCGILVAPEQSVAVAVAMVRVFAAHGDRTDRKKARLCYLLERIGVDRFLELTQQQLAFPLLRAGPEQCQPRAAVDRHAHLGVRRQRQPQLRSIGIAIPVGRMSVDQMLGLADLADDLGSKELRTTVWQNIIVPDVAESDVAQALRAIRAIGYDTSAGSIAAGLVACTGNTGCRFSATDTKAQAIALSRRLDGRVELDRPLNIHVTGCPNSCAQHVVADIGLLGAQLGGGESPSHGYHVYVGGGIEDQQALGRELVRNVPVEQLAPLLERLLRAYLAQREGAETFGAFARRRDIDALRALTGSAQA